MSSPGARGENGRKLFLSAGLLLASGTSFAATFTTIDAPNATDTGLYCVNAVGELCGSWTDSSGTIHGLLITPDGQAHTFDYPGATATYVIGLNARGDSVGLYDAPNDHGWMQLQGQSAHAIEPPGSATSIARSINDSGSVAGGYTDSSGTMHGFVLSGSAYQTIDFPRSTATDAWDIDATGDVVGQYTGSDHATHGFLLKGGVFSSIDFPGATFTIADRITDDGRILGFYTLADGKGHGFLYANGAYTSIDVPGATATRARGLNVAGEIAGFYIDGTTGHSHGFTTNGAPDTSTSPPFSMTVTGTITATSANVQAQVVPPPQLVGTAASIYVFAHVRESLLAPKKAAAPAPERTKDGPAPDPCVLAQLNANGQLVPVTASSLQAYLTGVLGSQSQLLTILSNVATANVAGATFYVGFGISPGAMFSNGLYQGAITVPGRNGCSGALLTGAAPSAPGSLSGLWWNPDESGWGVSFTERASVIFAAWFTYDASGLPKWYVGSDCAMTSAATGASRTCKGSLYEASGPAFFGTSFNPSLLSVAPVGTLQVTFQDPNNASMTYDVRGQGRTVQIVRQVFASAATPPAVDYTDLWWNPAEPGWGMAVTHEYGVIFLTWYVYDGTGKPLWYVSSNCTVVGSGCSGTLYQTSGPPLGPTFDPAAVHATAVGTVVIGFVDANNALLAFTVNGVTSTKVITRQLF